MSGSPTVVSVVVRTVVSSRCETAAFASLPHTRRSCDTRHRGAGHRIGKVDVIISRRNDPTLNVYDARDVHQRVEDPVRNGQRWHVDPDHHRIAARRLSDGARAVFARDYLREHVNPGFALTAHSAQGVTADTTHAVLAENTHRNLLYVAMLVAATPTPPTSTNAWPRETDHEHRELAPGVHMARRGTPHDAAALVRTIIGAGDERARTAHDVAADTDHDQLPERVAGLLKRRTRAVARRRALHQGWHRQTQEQAIHRERGIDLQRSRSQDCGIEL